MSFGSVTNFNILGISQWRWYWKLTGYGVKGPRRGSLPPSQDKRVETLKNNRDSRGTSPVESSTSIKPFVASRVVTTVVSISKPRYSKKLIGRLISRRPNTEIPHYVMELARPEFFAFVAPRRHIFNHHLPWAYSKGVWGVLEWLEKGEEVVKGRELPVAIAPTSYTHPSSSSPPIPPNSRYIHTYNYPSLPSLQHPYRRPHPPSRRPPRRCPALQPTSHNLAQTSFTWMAYRSGYATKDVNQLRILAFDLTITRFIDLLSAASLSSNVTGEVVVQWDPERDLGLRKIVGVRSLQMGVKGSQALRHARGKGL
ncbi:hypothetical protein BC829DRAFT_416225 [Chytridium lagenaria]|nr:hypothetical protein BC829DRAFT_416225 [Chytridium lagenaria]